MEVLRSSIKPQLMSSVLMKGTILSSLGGGALLYAGVYLPADILQKWGLLIFLISLVLITAGLLPYRKLTRLEKHPNEIHLIGNKTFAYFIRGKPAFSISMQSIQKFILIDKGKDYGIGVILKDPLPEPILVQDPSFNIISFQKGSRRHYHCDFFLTCFTERSFNCLPKKG